MRRFSDQRELEDRVMIKPRGYMSLHNLKNDPNTRSRSEFQRAERSDRVMREDQIKHMVDRFLNWRLPSNFNPDSGITAVRPNYHPSVEWTPTGTNLLDGAQTEAMIRYLIKDMPS